MIANCLLIGCDMRAFLSLFGQPNGIQWLGLCTHIVKCWPINFLRDFAIAILFGSHCGMDGLFTFYTTSNERIWGKHNRYKL